MPKGAWKRCSSLKNERNQVEELLNRRHMRFLLRYLARNFDAFQLL